MKYLKIFTDFLAVIDPLTEAEAGRLFAAMLRYAQDGAEPALTGNERFLWQVARQHIDREAAAYESKVKHLRRGPFPVTEKKIPVSEEDNDKDNDNDNDNDKDNDIYRGAQAPAPTARIYKQPPRLEEIETYCRERGSSVDPRYFFDYYEANGWRMGKTPMKDWQAAVRSWESNGRGAAPKPGARSSFLAAMERARREEAKEL